MRAIGAAQDFEGHQLVNPEGGSKPREGVTTSVATSETVESREAVETARRRPRTRYRLSRNAKTSNGRTTP